MAAKKGTQPTLAEVRKWPATVSVPRAALALGCSRSQLYELIKRGEAPVKTLSFGSRHVVITAHLVAVLEAA
ncbi:helix-turn-helix transcriptional regulator [Streptomyces eurythermus]|uniref:helix-turn-helix transcriptional regulator n=1 Tax=Streptomyces eurythermus TaxID=42237 RepID=UPI0036D25EB0